MELTSKKNARSPTRMLSIASKYWMELALALTVFVAFIPTLLRLADGPWRTEQEGHGPIVIAAAAWLAFQAWQKSRANLAKGDLAPERIEQGRFDDRRDNRRLDRAFGWLGHPCGHALARRVDAGNRRANPDYLRRHTPVVRLERSENLRLSHRLPDLRRTAARLDARRLHRAHESHGFRLGHRNSLSTGLSDSAEWRDDHGRPLSADGERRLFRHELGLCAFRHRLFLCA